MLELFRTKLQEVIKATAPLVAVVIVVQVAFIHAPIEAFLQFLGGTLLTDPHRVVQVGAGQGIFRNPKFWLFGSVRVACGSRFTGLSCALTRLRPR